MSRAAANDVLASGAGPDTLHASCVAIAGQAVLIIGASGSGKSALALTLMAHGATLIADDRTQLSQADGQVFARCPEAIQGKIEARGIGILRADRLETAPVRLVVDLDRAETQRLPPKRQCDLFGVPIDLVFGATCSHLPYAILQYVRAGRMD
ncbi:HPr kinase/phosphorylase [Pseudorhodobacter sp. E13]|uniref:HPr kinase/phosphorylase n=1 Tax=Pseudorhodobacter sp. E13 TaxID=2487931 RepID=UPI001F28BA26|nr:HPr kinase/phosphatase C-terminal domain-containing protein [Pseudorhodobacter sp. E13]